MKQRWRSHRWLQASLARRLLLALLLAYAVLGSCVYFLGRYGTHRSDLGTFDRDLKSLALAIAHTLDDSPTPLQAPIGPVFSSFDHVLASYHEHKLVVEDYMSFYVWGREGEVIHRSPHALPLYAFDPNKDGFFDHLPHPAQGLRVYAQWTQDRRYRVDVLQTQASRQTQYDSAMLNASNGIVLGISLLVLWLLTVAAVQWSLRPLRRLSQELALRPPDDLTPLPPDHIDPELRPVIHNMNHTLARLQTVLTHERHALADLAHELRTPLAIMTHQVDQIRRSPDAAVREAAILRLEQVLQRTNRLTHQLLVLGRLQSTTETQWQTVALPDVIRDALAAHASWAATRRIHLSYVGPETLNCDTVGVCIDLILDNLIRNALIHGHEGGHIEVRLLPTNNQADLPILGQECIELAVLDDGPGLSEAERQTVWQRFQRGAHASPQGTGLGLSIVASAAQQMGASIHTHQGLDGKGLGIAVIWPLRTAHKHHAPRTQ